MSSFQEHFENTSKKGAAAPSAPPLNPPMISKQYNLLSKYV